MNKGPKGREETIPHIKLKPRSPHTVHIESIAETCFLRTKYFTAHMVFRGSILVILSSNRITNIFAKHMEKIIEK